MKILVLMAHPDDETLGCGGYIPKLLRQGHFVSIVYLSNGLAFPPKVCDNRNDAFNACKILGVEKKDIYFLGFKNGAFNSYPLIEINKKVENLGINPDFIITNAPTDVNKDHEVTFSCAMVIGRPINKQINIICAEVLSSCEWGETHLTPNFYVDITDTLDLKINAMKQYKQELREFPHTRSIESIIHKAKQRGIEVGYKAAEAYRIIRWFDLF